MNTRSGPETPQRSSPISSQPHSTPLSQNSSKLPESDKRTQDVLKLTMRQELAGAVFKSDRLIEHIYPNCPDSEAHNVITHMTKKNTLRFDPVPNTKEEDSYKPFIHLLNGIIEAMDEKKLMKNSVYKDTKFEVYDKPMKEGTGSDDALKPDLISRSSKRSGTTSASWTEVELCVEVKNNFMDMVAQGSTYARSLFYFQRARRFVTMIYLHHGRKEVRFGIYTASWLCLSNPINIGIEPGLREFVKSMVRIYSCRNWWDAGFDTSCNMRKCSIKGLGVYSITDNLCHRNSILGRRTRVDVMDKSMCSASKLVTFLLILLQTNHCPLISISCAAFQRRLPIRWRQMTNTPLYLVVELLLI